MSIQGPPSASRRWKRTDFGTPSGTAFAVRVSAVPESRSPSRGSTIQPATPSTRAEKEVLAVTALPALLVTRTRGNIVPKRWIGVEKVVAVAESGGTMRS